ncbi:MAG: alpha-glucan family phosphorylase, partial [Rikenellaceae bacterium]
WMLPMERTFNDQRHQNELDAELIYKTIENQIAPLYYQSAEEGESLPVAWLQFVKSCIANVASNFTTNRMLIDYEERFYNKLRTRGEWIKANDYQEARNLAAWKGKVYSYWNDIKIVDIQRARLENEQILVGKNYHFEITLDLGALDPTDVGVEIVMASQIEAGQRANIVDTMDLHQISTEGNLATFALDYVPTQTGSYDLAMRIYPKSDKFEHRMDVPLVRWA